MATRRATVGIGTPKQWNVKQECTFGFSSHLGCSLRKSVLSPQWTSRSPCCIIQRQMSYLWILIFVFSHLRKSWPGSCLHPVAAINTMTKSNLWRTGFVSAYRSQAITEESLGRSSRQELGDHDHGGVLFLGLLPLVSSSTFLMYPKATVQGWHWAQ